MTQKEARRQYGRFVADAFGAVIGSPWEQLRFGLALGSEAFVDRMRGRLALKDSPQLSWVSRAEDGEKRRRAGRLLAQGEQERRWRVWVRVHLGGEPRIHLAREYGYGGGSAITQILLRLETRARIDTALRARLSGLRAEHERQCEEWFQELTPEARPAPRPQKLPAMASVPDSHRAGVSSTAPSSYTEMR